MIRPTVVILWQFHMTDNSGSVDYRVIEDFGIEELYGSDVGDAIAWIYDDVFRCYVDDEYVSAVFVSEGNGRYDVVIIYEDSDVFHIIYNIVTPLSVSDFS